MRPRERRIPAARVEDDLGPDPAPRLAGLVSHSPCLPADWGPDALRAAGAASGRVVARLRARAVRNVARVADEVVRGRRPASDLADLRARLGWSPQTFADAIAVGRALRRLPRLRTAFRTGRVGYAKVRAVAGVVIPQTDAGWTRLCERHPTSAVEAWASAARPGEPAPDASAGAEPLRPLGSTIPEECRVDLSPAAAEPLAALQQVLERALGRALGPESLVAALAGWWLAANVRDENTTIVYQPSPSTRLLGPGAILRPTLRRILDPRRRLLRAFAWIAPALARPPKKPRRVRESRDPRHIRRLWREAVRFRDGERCIVPGCGRDLTTQHDHWTAVAKGGRANPGKDRRLCGACNRAKARGLIKLIERGDGTIIVLDSRLREVGSLRLGTAWDGPLLAWCLAAARREIESAAARASGRDFRAICATRDRMDPGAATGRGPPVAPVPRQAATTA